jgi:ketosteroid isomerase-like protein
MQSTDGYEVAMSESPVNEKGAPAKLAAQIASDWSRARTRKDVDRTMSYVAEEIFCGEPRDRLEGAAAFRRFWAEFM